MSFVTSLVLVHAVDRIVVSGVDRPRKFTCLIEAMPS